MASSLLKAERNAQTGQSAETGLDFQRSGEGGAGNGVDWAASV
jgi:hypothetical protein